MTDHDVIPFYGLDSVFFQYSVILRNDSWTLADIDHGLNQIVHPRAILMSSQNKRRFFTMILANHSKIRPAYPTVSQDTYQGAIVWASDFVPRDRVIILGL